MENQDSKKMFLRDCMEKKIMKNIIVILGTRPEAIKLAPVILELRKNPEYRVFVCNTEQQKNYQIKRWDFLGLRQILIWM